ncbi:uncharacterized protein LOC106646122 [Copidosoma floridanum]|uniref:uncharacterized protein LOC106646122 n=1 Tax=Copidosoma floridanum TaxID=29053 RepID=UPI0006C94E5C|nr:uncharacterized protein LOC106646122 [Copidosoma floridanum]
MNSSSQLHGFCDASSHAYGAVVYLRTVDSKGHTTDSLIMGKTKVAPLKQLNIHRLELQAALLLAQLIKALREVRIFQNVPVQCWTDSSITLSWLSKHASTWKLFVSNRVAEVHELLPNHKWRHVPTDSNPADLASRGVEAATLVGCDLWWTGPHWLSLTSDAWPNTFPDLSTEADSEAKAVTHHATRHQELPLERIASKFSSWEKAVQVTAYLLRYIKNLKSRLTHDQSVINQNSSIELNLTAQELFNAKVALFRHVQEETLASEIHDVKGGQCVSSKSKVCLLNPFCDNNTGLLRVGGRSSQSQLPYDSQHPIILLAHPLVSALIRSTLIRCLHGAQIDCLNDNASNSWSKPFGNIGPKTISSPYNIAPNGVSLKLR